MKPTRKYTCTRRTNKNNDRIWVVLEVGKKFYRIFSTQAKAMEYFKALKIPAEMKVQEGKGNLFTKLIFTREEMSRKNFKSDTVKITTRQVVKDSDKLLEEKSEVVKKLVSVKPTIKSKPEIKPKLAILAIKPKSKPATTATKPAAKPTVKKSITKPIVKSEKQIKIEKPIEPVKPIEVIKYVEKIINVNPHTGEIFTEEEVLFLREKNKKNLEKIFDKSSTNYFLESSNLNTYNTNDLISELKKLDDNQDQFNNNKPNTVNVSIIDEILKRKLEVENTWTNSNSDYVKEVVKPIVINTQKIEFNDDPIESKNSTIESIVKNRVEETNANNDNYMKKIKEHPDYKKTQIQTIQNLSIDDKELVPEKTTKSSTHFWVLTILISLIVFAGTALVVLYLI